MRTLFDFFETLYNVKKAELDNVVRSKILSMLSEGLNTVEIAIGLQRDHRTIKAFIQDSKKCPKQWKTRYLKSIKQRERTHLNIAMKKTPLFTIRNIFVDFRYLTSVGLFGSRLMIWPTSSTVLNPIKNMWSIIKRDIYISNELCSSKNALWEAIVMACNRIQPDSIRN